MLIFVVIRRAFRTGFDVLCDRPLTVTYAVLLGYMLIMALTYLASLAVLIFPEELKTWIISTMTPS